MIDIDELLELEAKATQGYWEFVRHSSGVQAWICNEEDYIFPAGDKDYYPADIANQNGEFICSMRNNIRPLLLELKAARKVVEAVKNLDWTFHDPEHCPFDEYDEDSDEPCTCGTLDVEVALSKYFKVSKELEGGEK